MAIQAIETRYAGCRFRSRLEARWAVFFEAAGIAWEYEPQGFVIGGRGYLPDFLLTDCGTWVEVKGTNDNIDQALLDAAAGQLPKIRGRGEPGPRLMLLGPIPEVPKLWFGYDERPDLGWCSSSGEVHGRNPFGFDYSDTVHTRAGFGVYHKNRRPWHLSDWENRWTVEASVDRDEYMREGIAEAYRRARTARFEHGERG